jgi:hypothetical protein
MHVSVRAFVLVRLLVFDTVQCILAHCGLYSLFTYAHFKSTFIFYTGTYVYNYTCTVLLTHTLTILFDLRLHLALCILHGTYTHLHCQCQAQAEPEGESPGQTGARGGCCEGARGSSGEIVTGGVPCNERPQFLTRAPPIPPGAGGANVPLAWPCTVAAA